LAPEFQPSKPLSFRVDLSGTNSLIRYTGNPLARISEAAGETPPLFVFDSNTRNLIASPDEDSCVIPPGEGEKRWEHVAEIEELLLERKAARDSLLVAVGGGVVCDLGAFAASIYMRGMRLILVPTTLLSMVDASLGGKTGVDFLGYKNILGSFYPAEEVIISPPLLETLPQREYRNGLAEVIKHAILADDELYVLLRDRREEVLAREPGILREIIYRSQRVKARYVQQDPKEKGIRGHLNLGHTFGHALESLGNLSAVSHGEAVAWGIVKALDAGVEMGITDSAYAEELRELFISYGYTTEGLADDPEALVDASMRDKKKRGGELRFILQRKRGDTLFSPVERDILLRVLQRG